MIIGAETWRLINVIEACYRTMQYRQNHERVTHFQVSVGILVSNDDPKWGSGEVTKRHPN